MVTVLLGLLIGATLGLTGAGGGVLAVPLLMAVLHLPLPVAAPVALTAVALAAALGAALAWRAGRVRYRAAALMAGLGVVVSPAGIWLASRLPATPLALAFAAVLLWAAWRMAKRPVQRAADAVRTPCQLNAGTGRLQWNRPCAWALAGTGAVAGGLSGLLGVGGGFVIVPALDRFTNLNMASVVGTSLAVVALVSAWGVVASAAMGHLQVAMAAQFAAGSAVGMLAARPAAAHLSPVVLQRGFAALAATVALFMAWQAVQRLVP